MKLKIFAVFVAASTLLLSCNSEDDNQPLSKWHLIEQLADPGDGSGTFQPVNSEKTISFFEDGSISSNGQLCTMSTESNVSSSGTYSESELAITPDNCGVAPFIIYYEMDGPNLILSYPCIEPCKEKYEPVD